MIVDLDKMLPTKLSPYCVVSSLQIKPFLCITSFAILVPTRTRKDSDKS